MRASVTQRGEVSVHTEEEFWFGVTGSEQVRRAPREGMPRCGQPQCSEGVHTRGGPA